VSFDILIPSIHEIYTLLKSAHKSRGGTVLLNRGGHIMANPSAKSILNAWHTEDLAVQQILHTSLLELCGSGDGAKTGCFMALDMIKSYHKMYGSPHPAATQHTLDCLPDVIRQIEPIEADKDTLFQIGLESTLPEEDVEKIAQALFLSGVESHIALEKWDGSGCEVVAEEAFTAQLKVHAEKEHYLNGPLFALFAQPLFDTDILLPILEMIGSFEGRPLVIVAPLVGGKALDMVRLNTSKGAIEAYCCDAPRVTWGKGWLDDLASFVGATVYDPLLTGSWKSEYFGSAYQVVLNFNQMIVYPYEDHAEKTAQRAEQLLYEASTIGHNHTKDLWQKRASALTGSLVRLKVGGVTETDARFRRVLAEKALLSMADALRNGYVRGAIPTLHNLSTPDTTLRSALDAPLRVVAENKESTLEECLNINELYQPFPAGRLANLLRKATSISTTLASIGFVVRRGK
jgi:hypothetical protein